MLPQSALLRSQFLFTSFLTKNELPLRRPLKKETGKLFCVLYDVLKLLKKVFFCEKK